MWAIVHLRFVKESLYFIVCFFPLGSFKKTKEGIGQKGLQPRIGEDELTMYH